jgi:hypothetical protein
LEKAGKCRLIMATVHARGFVIATDVIGGCSGRFIALSSKALLVT